jgi:hypothetical protein
VISPGGDGVSIVVLLNEASANLARGGIEFAAMANDERISCFISQEALRDHFGSSAAEAESLIDVFYARQGRIHSTVRGKIADGAREADGSVVLRSADFWM